MSPRMVATAAALVGLMFGAIGLIVPGTMATAFGASLDRTGEALARLACASYDGFGVLAWLARDLTDARAWRAVAGGSAVSWALGGVVMATGGLSGLAGGQAWLIVAMQILFTLAWSRVYARA